jgi:hypothetical protein
MKVAPLVRALQDLLRGLFGFPDRPKVVETTVAAALEERYSRPRRCC